MRRLTAEERTALVEVGPPGEGPIPWEVFDELVRLGWGYWAPDPTWWRRLLGQTIWYVTAAGRYALELDTLARQGNHSL